MTKQSALTEPSAKKPRRRDPVANRKAVAKCLAKKRDIRTPGTCSPRPGLDFERPAAGDVEAWLLTYLPGAFPLPFGPVHRDIMEAVDYAIRTGGHVAIAAPRGTGKSTLVNALALRALLEGLSPFPVTIPWDDKAKRRALRFWAGELSFNERIHRDYEQATAVFKHARGVSHRLIAATQCGEATGARLGVTEGVIVLPNGLGAIGSATVNGNPRGLNYATIDGRVVRPSLALVDDPQDRETAKSKPLVQDVIERIDGDIAGMAGPDSRMPIIMCCTVIERDDVAEHYLTNPDWRAVRVGQVVQWPDGWADKGSPARLAWHEWNMTRQDDGDDAALAYYREHAAAMTAGMVVSWDARYDAKRGHPDARYAAMLDWHVMGEEAFAAERQNAPIQRGVTVYTLTPAIIESRVVPRQPGALPEWARLRVAATDINPSYGLTWGVVAFGADQTAAVLGYGVDPMGVPTGATDAEAARQIYEALVAHGRRLAALPCRPEAWVVDAGGAAFDTVLRFAGDSLRLCGLPCLPATGRGARNYRPYGRAILGKPREQCHMAVDVKGRKWVAWNADYWREVAQKAWTGTAGAPGSCSLPTGHHREFAEQVCREQLAGKGEVGGAMVWTWNTLPGRHDYGDVMAMAYMGAAWSGVGTAGQDVEAAPVKARVVISRPSDRRGWR